LPCRSSFFFFAFALGFNYFVCSASELEFSPTQIAKMHCTIDWRYRSWIAQPPRSPPSGQNDDDDDNGKRFGWGDGLAVLIGFLAVGALAFYFIRKRRREAAARQPAGGYHLQGRYTSSRADANFAAPFGQTTKLTRLSGSFVCMHFVCFQFELSLAARSIFPRSSVTAGTL
jgi:LPXTG-motif cell wall-anchored protein